MDPSVSPGADQLRRLLDAVVSLSTETDLAEVLRRIVAAAVDLVGATYGALGVLDESRSHLAEFITVGMDDATIQGIGHLPEGHGILGLLIVEPVPIRLPDLALHPDSYGFPPGHPPMRSFLGVPVFVGEVVYGNLYLTDKQHGVEFTEADVALAKGLASAAGVAIDNIRLHARLRHLDVVEDRERIARNLHDTVIQRLFASGLSLQGITRVIERPDVAERVAQVIEDLDETVGQIRLAIFELEAPRIHAGGLRRQLLAISVELGEALGREPTMRFEGPVDTTVPPTIGAHVAAVVREGLSNVIRHANADRCQVSVVVHDGRVQVEVADDGVGPGTARPGSLGLANLTARANELGGTATLEPGESGGTTLRWSAPL